MGLVLVVYVIRNTNSAWQTFSSKMPLGLKPCWPGMQISQSRSAEQNSCWWRPDILIMHFSWSYLDLSEFVQSGKSLVLLGVLWMHCWMDVDELQQSSSCFIQFVYLDTAVWSKHEAEGFTTTFNSNFLSPCELKQEHRYALQWERRTGKSALKYLLLSGYLTVHHTFILGLELQPWFLYCLGHVEGKHKVLSLDTIRAGLKVNQILLPHGWTTGITPLPAPGKEVQDCALDRGMDIHCCTAQGLAEMGCRCCICRHTEFTVISG